MSFYIFKLDKLGIVHKRGNIPDKDVVSFTVFVDQVERGHAAGTFVALVANSVASTSDRTVDGLLAYPARRLVNASENWSVGPFEIRHGEKVSVIYTGTNISDEQLSSLGTQAQDELEIDVLNYVAKKYVELILGAGFGSDIGNQLSDAFEDYFKNPVGDLIGYQATGPCNGVVFSGTVPFTGRDLDSLNYVPIPSGTTHAVPPMPQYASTSFEHTYTDEATHDTNICGHIAETKVVFSVMKVSFISVKWALLARFPSRFPNQHGPGLRQYGSPGTTVSIKSMLGVRP